MTTTAEALHEPKEECLQPMQTDPNDRAKFHAYAAVRARELHFRYERFTRFAKGNQF